MPFENEHSARIKEPDQFVRIRRENAKDHDFGPGIAIYWGIKPKKKTGPEGGRTEIQAVHFDKDKFSAGEAKAWLKEHDLKPIEFVPAGKEANIQKKADILYPNLVAPEDFQAGDVVRKIFGDFRVTEYLGIVLAVHPTTNTVDVRWPYGIGFENPQDLVRVNPWFEPPSVVVNSEGYYTTWDAERWNTPNPEDNPTKGVSGKSPIYVDSTDAVKAPSDGGTFTASINNIPIEITATSGTLSLADNAIRTSIDFELIRKASLPSKIAKRYMIRSFNVLLRAATVPYNERFNEVDTYRFLYKRFASIYSEPTIRSVVAYLYCKPHNYYEEDFDQTLKKAIIAAQADDKKTLKKVFQEIIELTEGKKGTKINDLLDAAVDAPYAQAIYQNLKEAVKRAKGNLDILPTPAARFASSEANELEKIAKEIESAIEDES